MGIGANPVSKTKIVKRARVPQPTQPVVWDGDVLRFQCNAVVRYLLDWCTAKANPNRPEFQRPHIDINGPAPDLNVLSCMDFPREDWEQFYQLIGYSVSGYGSLSFVSDATYNKAARRANQRLKEAGHTGDAGKY